MLVRYTYCISIKLFPCAQLFNFTNITSFSVIFFGNRSLILKFEKHTYENCVKTAPLESYPLLVVCRVIWARGNLLLAKFPSPNPPIMSTKRAGTDLIIFQISRKLYFDKFRTKITISFKWIQKQCFSLVNTIFLRKSICWTFKFLSFSVHHFLR